MIGATLDQQGVSSVPDEALMKAVSRHRHDALAALYNRHGKRLRATIDGVVHEGAEADDVLQEIFMQIWEEAGRYSPRAGKPLDGWLPLRAAVPSTGCDGARLILACGSVIKSG